MKGFIKIEGVGKVRTESIDFISEIENYKFMICLHNGYEIEVVDRNLKEIRRMIIDECENS